MRSGPRWERARATIAAGPSPVQPIAAWTPTTIKHWSACSQRPGSPGKQRRRYRPMRRGRASTAPTSPCGSTEPSPGGRRGPQLGTAHRRGHDSSCSVLNTVTVPTGSLLLPLGFRSSNGSTVSADALETVQFSPADELALLHTFVAAYTPLRPRGHDSAMHSTSSPPALLHNRFRTPRPPIRLPHDWQRRSPPGRPTLALWTSGRKSSVPTRPGCAGSSVSKPAPRIRSGDRFHG